MFNFAFYGLIIMVTITETNCAILLPFMVTNMLTTQNLLRA